MRPILISSCCSRVLRCLLFPRVAGAVTPAPDGFYPGANTAEGFQSLQSLTTGLYNTAIGQQALFADTTGSFNTAEGFRALVHNTTGPFNTAIGVNALYSNTTAQRNVANGFDALSSITPPAAAMWPLGQLHYSITRLAWAIRRLAITRSTVTLPVITWPMVPMRSSRIQPARVTLGSA